MIHPSLKDIWDSVRLIEATYGFSLGLMQFTYQVFLYEHFGANPSALKLTVGLYMLTSIGIVLLEIPTGAWGDYAGRKRTLATCFCVAALAYFLRSWIYFVDSFVVSALLAALAAALYAVSYTLFSGTYTAWIVDAVRERRSSAGHGPILAGGYSYMMGGKIVGAMLGLWLYLSGLVFYASGLASIASLLCALFIAIILPETRSYRDQPRQRFDSHALQRMKQIIATGWVIGLRRPPVRYMILMYASFMIVIHLVNALWPIAVKDNFGVSRMSWHWYVIVFSGMLSAYFGTKCLSGLMTSFAALPKHQQSQKLWKWFSGGCLLMASTILVLGFCKLQGLMTLSVFINAFIIFNVAYGFLMPACETLINAFIPTKNSSERATINSLSPMLAETLLLFIALPASGPTGENTVVGWMLPAAILFILTCIIHLRMRVHVQSPVTRSRSMPVSTIPEESEGG